jgi:hypothetical protein
MRLRRYFLLSVSIMLLGCNSQPLCTPQSPCIPGGGGGVIGGQIDAPKRSDAALDASNIVGRICLTTDLRFPLRCASTGAEGFTITYGDATASSTGDGSFAFSAAPTVAATTLKATRSGFVTSVIPRSNGSFLIPTTLQQTFDTFMSDNAFPLPADHGTVVARVLKSGAPLLGAKLVSNPISLQIALYAGANASIWETKSTVADAVIALPGILQGNVEITVAPAVGAAKKFVDIPVVGGAVTFVALDVTP